MPVEARGRSTEVSALVSNALWLIGGEVSARVLAFLSFLWLTRVLSAGMLGTLELGLAALGLAHLVSVGGAEVLAVRSVARGTHAERGIAGMYVWTGWVAGLILVPAVLLVAWLSGRPSLAVWFAVSYAAIGALIMPLAMRFFFLGREQMSTLAAGELTSAAARLPLILLFVHRDEDLVWAPAIWATAESVRAGALLCLFHRRAGSPRLAPHVSRLAVWFRGAMLPAVGKVGRGLFFVFDLLLLGLLAPLEELGLYAVAVRLPLLALSLAEMVRRSLFPSAVRLAASGEQAEFAKFQSESVKAAVSLGFPVALAMALVAEPLMTQVFGPTWGPSAPLMSILVWRLPLGAITLVHRNVVWAVAPASDGRVAGVGFGIMAVLVSAGATAHGAAGCAVGMLAAEAILLALYARAARAHVRLPLAGHMGWVARVAIGATAIVATAQLAYGLHPWARIALSALVALGVGVWTNWYHLVELLKARSATVRSQGASGET